MKRLKDRTCVVTGAASGIGRATAYAAAQAGCHLALVDIDADGLAEVQQQIKGDVARDSQQLRSYEVDVGDGDAVHRLAGDVVNDFGAVHIVVNNAGINVTARFDDHTLEDFQRTFDVNLWGVIHGCRAFLPHLRQVEEAHIVNISSAFGIVGVAGQAAYSASKFAVRGLSESLHEELAPSSIGVSVVHPGCIDTNIIQSARIQDGLSADDIQSYFDNHGCSPEVVARRIIRAIERDEHRVLVTPETHFVDWLRRIFPTTGNRIANHLMSRFVGIDFNDR